MLEFYVSVMLSRLQTVLSFPGLGAAAAQSGPSNPNEDDSVDSTLVSGFRLRA